MATLNNKYNAHSLLTFALKTKNCFAIFVSFFNAISMKYLTFILQQEAIPMRVNM